MVKIQYSRQKRVLGWIFLHQKLNFWRENSKFLKNEFLDIFDRFKSVWIDDAKNHSFIDSPVKKGEVNKQQLQNDIQAWHSYWQENSWKHTQNVKEKNQLNCFHLDDLVFWIIPHQSFDQVLKMRDDMRCFSRWCHGRSCKRYLYHKRRPQKVSRFFSKFPEKISQIVTATPTMIIIISKVNC